ncbi:hypothetical protein [Heyndrickxia oleronia]|uniref:Uncharacterized protein n=1 Tax=Heyndrickxia oleronia TaxID=38875 RepID=A0AAW6SYN3_9BACI|nr:hypothetical protein [Heyndrickxia oleronia]MDH5163929.1 hypothetical protein [Heyndrickxia oleronia]
MKNWIITVALNFLLEYIIFFIGAYGQTIFMVVHKGIVKSNPETFGIVCTMITAFILICFTFKLRNR